MKLEKLNENQIRCTLSKSDLAKRELRLSELAYGSAKANALFRDMMQQASIELGFEADNIPLMIEAIPVSSDCLVLVVTKVEDPDELDTRFSRFSKSSGEDLEFEDDFETIEENAFANDFEEEALSFTNEEEEEGRLRFSSDKTEEKNDHSSVEEALDLIAPFTQAIAQAKKEVIKKQQEAKSRQNNLQLFSFKTLGTVTMLSTFLTPFYEGESRLYKDGSSNIYYLVLQKENSSTDTFRRACNIASDYGTKVSSSYASLSYFEEHFQLILREQALFTLNQLR